MNIIICGAGRVGFTIAKQLSDQGHSITVIDPSIEDIQKKVSEHFSVKMSEMFSARRSKSVVIPRQVAMYLSKELTNLSYPEIGRNFGGKDHTTIIHASKKIDKLLNENSHISEDIKLLKSILSN